MDQSCRSLLILSQVSRIHLHICTDPPSSYGSRLFLTAQTAPNTKHCPMQTLLYANLSLHHRNILLPSDFTTKMCTHFTYSSCELHVSPISLSLNKHYYFTKDTNYHYTRYEISLPSHYIFPLRFSFSHRKELQLKIICSL